MVHIVTSENYREIVSSPGIVIVDCWASWCGACKTFTPIFEKVAENHPNHLRVVLPRRPACFRQIGVAAMIPVEGKVQVGRHRFEGDLGVNAVAALGVL